MTQTVLPLSDQNEVKGLWMLPTGWKWKRIEEICDVNPPRPRIKRAATELTSFLPMSGVDEGMGNIKMLENQPYSKVAKGFTYFEEGDILFAKITPSMQNGKCTIARNLIDGFGFGSTEFHVIRPKVGIASEWIHRYLRRLDFRNEAKGYFRGAVGQQRVPEEFIKNNIIPVPLLSSTNSEQSVILQRRILTRLEGLLNEVKELQELVKVNQKTVQQIMDQALAEFFNNDDMSSWSIKPLGEIINVKGGKRLPKGDDYSLYPTQYPYLRVVDFKKRSIDTTNIRYLTPEIYRQIAKYTISKEDVYISIAGTIGLVGTIPDYLDGANLTENAAKLVIKPGWTNKLYNKFLVYFLCSPLGKKQIEERSKAAGQPKLALERIRTIIVNFPNNINSQRQIVTYLDSIQSEVDLILNSIDEDLERLQQAEQALLEEAFRGEL